MLHLCHGVITSFKAGWMKDDFSFELFFTVMSSLENSFFQFDLSLYDTKETRGPILQNAFNNNIWEIASLLQLNWVCAKFIVVTNWLKRIGSWGFNENHQRGVFKKNWYIRLHFYHGFSSPVKLVYNDHNWDSKILAVVDRWSLPRSIFKRSKWDLKMVPL